MDSHTRLFVGNLPDNTNESDLQIAFSSYGEIKALDLKCKSTDEENKKNFAFISLSASNYEIESCIKHFSSEDYKGKRLYVTRARESFLERLQREREQANKAPTQKKHHEKALTKNPVIKLGDKLNPRKRKIENNLSNEINDNGIDHKAQKIKHKNKPTPNISLSAGDVHGKIHEPNVTEDNKQKNNSDKKITESMKKRQEFKEKQIVKKEPSPDLSLPSGDVKKNVLFVSESNKKINESDKKRIESMKKKRQEFKEKQMIIKTGLIGIDKVQNKKVIFSDSEDTVETNSHAILHKQSKRGKANNQQGNTLFDEDDSGDEVNFEIKEQFEGKKGQKVLDLQSRYKSDKRFVLDGRFIEDQSDGEKEEYANVEEDNIELEQTDEKAKQMNILQDVLGVTIRTHFGEQANNKKIKSKLGMLRFDPSQPEHAKFLAPVEEKQEQLTKNSKKKKSKEKPVQEAKPEIVEQVQKVEVSKEQFYKVSEALKEAIVQPTTFSLRSLFAPNNDDSPSKVESTEQDTGFIPLTKAKDPKIKNPLQPGEKNPFVYDSSDSESEDEKKTETVNETTENKTEIKAVWKENLFFSKSDYRFKEGLAFFNKVNEDGQKERRELKSLMKKRIYNKERKNQLFQKKIGGKKKTMKKSFRMKR